MDEVNQNVYISHILWTFLFHLDLNSISHIFKAISILDKTIWNIKIIFISLHLWQVSQGRDREHLKWHLKSLYKRLSEILMYLSITYSIGAWQINKNHTFELFK